MDTTTLVSDLIDDGRRIVGHLTRHRFEVRAAFWLKKSEDGNWSFYIVSPAAQPGRLSDAYALLFTLVRQLPKPHWITPLEVKLLRPTQPLARDVLAIYASAPNSTTGPLRRGWTMLGNVSVEEAYLYPLPATVSS